VMNPLHLKLWLGLALCGAARAAAPAEETPSLSALSRGVERVVRGTVLDQERAPGGLWHRFQVLEAIWPPHVTSADFGLVVSRVIAAARSSSSRRRRRSVS